MALREKTIVEQRLSAIELLALGMSVRDVAERMGVSRQAVYDWQKRHAEQGAEGLKDRSRRPHHSPHRTAERIEQRLIEERNKWRFGSKKILRRLQDAEPEIAWPPRSTVDAIFKRAGLVEQRRKVPRPFAPAATERAAVAEAAGQKMTIDFKGQFRLGTDNSAIRSRSSIPSVAICWRVMPSPGSPWNRPGPHSRACFASTACPRACIVTTVFRSAPQGMEASRP